MLLLDGTVRLSRPRPVSGVNHIAPTRLADGKASLDPLRSDQFRAMKYTVHLSRFKYEFVRVLVTDFLFSVFLKRCKNHFWE